MRSKTACERIRFEGFEADLDCGELFYEGRKVPLQDKPFQVLRLLLENSGQLVTREQLRHQLWPADTFVDFDHNLNKAVAKLREALGNAGAKSHLIETLTRRGYRFIGEIEAIPPVLDELAIAPKETSSASLPTSPINPGTMHRRDWLLPASLTAIAVALVATTVGPHPLAARFMHGKAQPAISSLAVIPLDNLSGDPSQEYFADGMTDELITMLAKDSSLRIVSRTSVMQYKGARRPLGEIARELNVDGILEGSASRSGNRVHMNLQLIQAPTDTHLWAESYDRDASDIAALPNEAAQAIAKQLRSSVLSASPARYVSPEAHDAYLHGRYLWYAGQNDKAFEYFKKAIQLQPDYAPGWTGLAMYYGAGAVLGYLDPAYALAPEKEAAIKAVQLDDSFAEGHLSLCAAILTNDWDFRRADQQCLRAIDLDPEFAEAHHFRAKLLGAFNRNDEAIEAQKKAAELDPVARPWAMAMAYLVARREDAAIADARQRLESYPESVPLMFHLHDAYRRKGMDKEAAQTLVKVFQLSHDPVSAAAVQRAFQQGGYKAVVRWELSKAIKDSKTHYVCPIELARLYAQLRKREQSLALLEEGYRQHAPRILWIQSEPAFDFLHSDERYRSIIKRIGLPPAY
jgi:TolB-like protein/DNA-binding winged helix-turn-helix (wHTH) protein